MKKQGIIRLIKTGKKAMSLFSKLNGLGVIGFNGHQSGAKDEKKFTENKNLFVQNKQLISQVPGGHQQQCHEQFNSKPGHYQRNYIQVDLWFYLSGRELSS